VRQVGPQGRWPPVARPVPCWSLSALSRLWKAGCSALPTCMICEGSTCPASLLRSETPRALFEGPWLVAGARFVSRYHRTRIRETTRHPIGSRRSCCRANATPRSVAAQSAALNGKQKSRARRLAPIRRFTGIASRAKQPAVEAHRRHPRTEQGGQAPPLSFCSASASASSREPVPCARRVDESRPSRKARARSGSAAFPERPPSARSWPAKPRPACGALDSRRDHRGDRSARGGSASPAQPGACRADSGVCGSAPSCRATSLPLPIPRASATSAALLSASSS
jgi:hypothetical protein